MSIDWFAYVEQTQDSFIERFTDLDASEHPDKAAEISAAKRLKAIRDGMANYREATDEMLNEMRQFVLANPGQKYDEGLLRAIFPRRVALDNFGIKFGIKSEDVQRRIEQLRQGDQ